MISYTVIVSRDVVETCAVNVRAADQLLAVDQALAVVSEGDNLDWEMQDLTYQPTPYATIYDVEETE